MTIRVPDAPGPKGFPLILLRPHRCSDMFDIYQVSAVTAVGKKLPPSRKMQRGANAVYWKRRLSITIEPEPDVVFVVM
jgi:hypothetical protein